MQIIIDTNFMLTCVKQKIDLFLQLRNIFPGTKIVVPKIVIDELNLLSENKKLKMAEREAAEISVQILGSERIIILDLEGEADDAIVNYAKRNEVIIASLDRGIKSRLKKDRTKFLTIRGKKKVALQ